MDEWLQRQESEFVTETAARLLARRHRLRDGFTASELRKQGWSGLNTKAVLARALAYLVQAG